MEIKEIENRMLLVERISSGSLGAVEPLERMAGSICFWLAEIALQLAKGREQKNETGI